MIKLGQTVKCRVTGFSGIVTGHANYLSGCDQFLVAPPVDKDGNWKEGHWFDEQRLIVTDENALSYENPKNGADGKAPVK